MTRRHDLIRDWDAGASREGTPATVPTGGGATRPIISSSRRHDLVLAGLICELLALVFLGVIAWAQLRGFDPSMCQTHGGCWWRQA